MTSQQYLNYISYFMGGGGSWAKISNDFQSRVTADGGTIESLNCVTNAVKFMIQNP